MDNAEKSAYTESKVLHKVLLQFRMTCLDEVEGVLVNVLGLDPFFDKRDHLVLKREK
jgi:hypothetical protein